MSVDVENFATLAAKHDLRNLAASIQSASSKDDGVHEVIASESKSTRRLASVMEQPKDDNDEGDDFDASEKNLPSHHNINNNIGGVGVVNKAKFRRASTLDESISALSRSIGSTNTSSSSTTITSSTIPSMGKEVAASKQNVVSGVENKAGAQSSTPQIPTIIDKKPSDDMDDDEDADVAFVGATLEEIGGGSFDGNVFDESASGSRFHRRQFTVDGSAIISSTSSPHRQLLRLGADSEYLEDVFEDVDADGGVGYQDDVDDDRMKVMTSRWRLRSRRRAMMMRALSADCQQHPNNEDYLLPSLDERDPDDDDDDDDAEENKGDRKS